MNDLIPQHYRFLKLIFYRVWNNHSLPIDLRLEREPRKCGKHVNEGRSWKLQDPSTVWHHSCDELLKTNFGCCNREHQRTPRVRLAVCRSLPQQFMAERLV